MIRIILVLLWCSLPVLVPCLAEVLDLPHVINPFSPFEEDPSSLAPLRIVGCPRCGRELKASLL